MVMPVNGKWHKLMNATNTVVNYQVIGDTNQRTLAGGSDITLQNIACDSDLRARGQWASQVIPKAASQGLLEVILDETTSLDQDTQSESNKVAGLNKLD